MDREKVISGLDHCIPDPNKSLYEREEENERRHAECPYGGKEYEHGMGCFWSLMSDARDLLKEQEAVKPRVSTAEQRCGHCNKVIEMDGWKVCPWCGKPILWEAVGRAVK